jgi:hypothetical protein
MMKSFQVKLVNIKIKPAVKKKAHGPARFKMDDCQKVSFEEAIREGLIYVPGISKKNLDPYRWR